MFGSVQLTMMVGALRSGDRPHRLQWLGFALAFAGLVFLASPGVSAPTPEGAALMSLAGLSWGIYSLQGRNQEDPLGQTMGNFVRTVPFALLVSLVAMAQFHASLRGVILAVTSGALASGLGYTIWYRALRNLTAIRASVVQLSVPVLAAAGLRAVLLMAITKLMGPGSARDIVASYTSSRWGGRD